MADGDGDDGSDGAVRSASHGSDGRHLDAHGDVEDPVELGVELLANLEFGSLSVADAIDRLETITTHPRTTREILEAAEERGVIDREDGEVKPQGGSYVSFQSDVITKEGEFSCRRCGATISTGYFINFESGELGAFGSSCIRKVTGRE